MILEKQNKIEEKRERAIACSVKVKGSNREEALEDLDELVFLAETAGAEIIHKIYQELPKISSATVLGKGKLEEVKQIVKEENISLIIFDDNLSPAQVSNLEKELNIKVTDRSGIILDIFATRARTNEAKTQVELAQLQYILPRLTRMWTHLSKQYGGIGTRGPGETQIETDRRIIRLRIQNLKEKLKEIELQKKEQRKKRSEMPKFALVGYTNVGKSTLINTITNAGVYVEDKLFATLDTTVRQFSLPSGQKALISDTVGFIKKLPHNLVASFKSTLMEAMEADVLLHVIDVSHKLFREQIQTVNKTLEELKINEKPTIMVFNKVDMLDDITIHRALKQEFADSIFISAKRGINIESLLELMQEKYNRFHNIFEVNLPYEKSELVSHLYDNYEVQERLDTETSMVFKVKIQAEKEKYFENIFGKYISK
ncbi:MAG: GTPase HflX [Ignavibacteria bacterium]|nr:GTPase HflX [Ignavibacteria bacterium]